MWTRPLSKDWFYCPCALVFGLGIARLDSRPNWDDTGVTAFMLLLLATCLSFLCPRRAWLICLLSGIWIPLNGILNHQYSMALAFVVSMIGSLIGWALGTVVQKWSVKEETSR